MNDLTDYIIHLGDNALILGHRNSEWCGHGPVLEQDIAITNISLDLIGQARNFYQYAAAVKADGSTEDTLAYLRDPAEFKNFVLTELPKGDWAFTILRQFFFSNYQFSLYSQLAKHPDQHLAAIAAKALKEVTYHLRWSGEWVVRLGDGTAESRRRILDALDELWPFRSELLEDEVNSAAGINPVILRESWDEKTRDVFTEATINIPTASASEKYCTGQTGNHTHHLTDLLAEMQVLPRTYPGAEW